jgi:hypothetical protein
MTSAQSYLRCTVCGRESTTSFASSLRAGWERCCGYTMRLERTDEDISDSVRQVLSNPLPVRHEP